jgi:2-polyprenyl-6-methoxyphenol hydroxylase-like FAD-dependent oxidoreductase
LIKNTNSKIAIIGAGPAGCSCAITLRNAGFENVLVIDNSKTGKFHIGESIPPEMNQIMRQLGIYEAFYAKSHEPCFGSCSYWGNDKRGYNDSILSPFGHGWHLDRQAFNQFLIDECKIREVNVRSQAIYQQSEKTKNGFLLTLKNQNNDQEKIEADFVIDASGARSIFAVEQGSQKIMGTSLVCLGMRFKNKALREVSKLTHLESTEHGWWYAARVPGEFILVTLYTTAEVAKNLSLNIFKNWINLLQTASNTHDWIAQMEPYDNGLLGFGAPSYCLDSIVGEDWAAIGDAATAYDPITAQGIIKSFHHGMRVAELLSKSTEEGGSNLFNFENEVKAQYEQYLEARNHFYQLEQRWPNSPFWQAMHAL